MTTRQKTFMAVYVSASGFVCGTIVGLIAMMLYV